MALAVLVAPAAAQEPDVPAVGYTVFFRGTPTGREDIAVQTSTDGTVIRSQGRMLAPGNATLELVEIRYDTQGSPQSFTLDGSINGASVDLSTSFEDGSAVTSGEQGGAPVSVTSAVSPRSVVLMNGTFAGFAALPPRLAVAAVGDTFRVFILPTMEIGARVAAVANERMQSGTSLVTVRRYELILADPGGDLAVHITTALDGNLVRVNIPAQSIDVIRNDFASAAARTDIYVNPGDEPVMIPAPGFNLGATLTHPAKAAPSGTGVPAVVLITGAEAPDRDSLIREVPVMAQLAGTLADAGFLVVRYDRRGSGQSGGRAESATLAEYVDDVRTIVRWLSNRKDVDSRRIAVVGHGQGAWKAFRAAQLERRVAAVVSLAGAASKGEDLVLEQQARHLDTLDLSDAERAARVDVQKLIHTAIRTGRGWEQIPPQIRRQADTPWFQSLLAFDPSRVVNRVGAPVLIVHGQLDHEVPVEHAERLADLARHGDSRSVELVIVRGVNHLLMPAFTGEVNEYGTLVDRSISGDVTSTVAAWLVKTLPPRSR